MAMRAAVSMNPVFGISNKDLSSSIHSSGGPKSILKLLIAFPEFIQQGSNKVEVKLTDPESYTTLDSGIMYADIEHGTKAGDSITFGNQQVTLNYNHYAQCGRLIETQHFDGTPTKLAKTLGQGFGEALRDMKPTGYRRIIIPPTVTSFGEYRVVDVMLHTVDKPKFFHSKL